MRELNLYLPSINLIFRSVNMVRLCMYSLWGLVQYSNAPELELQFTSIEQQKKKKKERQREGNYHQLQLVYWKMELHGNRFCDPHPPSIVQLESIRLRRVHGTENSHIICSVDSVPTSDEQRVMNGRIMPIMNVNRSCCRCSSRRGNVVLPILVPPRRRLLLCCWAYEKSLS